MDVIEILESREKSIQIDVFVQQTKQVFNHYQALKSKIGNGVYSQSIYLRLRHWRSLVLRVTLRTSVLLKWEIRLRIYWNPAWVNKPVYKSLFSLVVSFLWYVFFIEVIKAQLIVAGISSVAAFFIIIYFLMKTTSKRLIATSQKIYAQQVDPRVLSYFEHYYS